MSMVYLFMLACLYYMFSWTGAAIGAGILVLRFIAVLRRVLEERPLGTIDGPVSFGEAVEWTLKRW